MSIIFSKKSDASIKLVTIVNGVPIVQISLNGCLGYIEPDKAYIGIIINDKFHVFNLYDHDDEIPAVLRSELENKSADIETLIDLTKNTTWQNSLKILEIKDQLQSIPNFQYIITPSCPELIDLGPAKKVIEKLNKILNCHLFRISINYIFEFDHESTTPMHASTHNTTLLLCLFRDKMCVSSIIITLKTNDNIKELEIDSNTEISYEGRKFNKLLRAVIIIIAKELDKEIRYVSSNAINPISLYLMIKYFKAIPYSFDNKEIRDLNTKENIENYLAREGAAFPKVILNEENIKNAEEVFETTVTKEFACKKGGKRKMLRNRKSKKTKTKRKFRKNYKKSKRRSYR